jgi:hypothetical protein
MPENTYKRVARQCIQTHRQHPGKLRDLTGARVPRIIDPECVCDPTSRPDGIVVSSCHRSDSEQESADLSCLSGHLDLWPTLIVTPETSAAEKG